MPAARDPERGAEAALPLPRGHHGLSREYIAHDQRERLMAATADLVAERGYAPVTVEEIIGRARVSRRAFYEHFRSKQDCFLATQQVASDELKRRVVEAASEEREWAERVRSGVGGAIRFFAEEPRLARLLLIESRHAGSEAAERLRLLLEAASSQLAARGTRGGGVAEGTDDVIAAGAVSIVTRALDGADGSARKVDPDELSREVAAFVLTPYLGAKRAEELAAQPG
ncbi:MAG: TetR/AcrR family transcriptional regulator [Acidimicrobiaceae bacterium]|nr:TetR/AcrR family transcriptional regulator [Acidimicrobiaceae bacterium]